ncbi:MAG TPA: exodeoxyribonuclease VII large subunit [Rhizomicrobium sp.]|nr:exodeoxyribonuclease VII large subunit [Rhizomicrobium sp.]
MSETFEPAPSTFANLPEYSVSELSQALKQAVEERFPLVRVRGEISGLKAATSGHTYFDLKDDKALLNAIVWRTAARYLKVKPEPGLDVICTGRITTYPGQSRYQLIVEQMELAGLGALMAMLEERKKRLAGEGLFDAARKKKLPFLPNVIGVITSPTGAVIRDIMHRLNARFPRRVLIWPVAVQGERAAAEIAQAIAGFNKLAENFPRPDLLIVARGGGSIEDLMAFNEEAVVRAAAASIIPLISAVGHETDTTLIDFASDMRAPTPTAAAELAVPVMADLKAQLADLDRRARNCFDKGLSDRRRHLSQLVRVLPRPEQLFASPRQRLDQAGERLGLALGRNLQIHRTQLAKSVALLRPHPIRTRIRHAREKLENLGRRARRCEDGHITRDRSRLTSLTRVLESISYRAVLERGFALVKGADGTLRRRAAQIKLGEHLHITFADGESGALAAGVPKARVKKPGSDQGSLF